MRRRVPTVRLREVLNNLPVRPEPVEGQRVAPSFRTVQVRSWFDKPVLSEVEGLTVNGLMQRFLSHSFKRDAAPVGVVR